MKELSFYLPRDAQPRDLRTVLDLMARGDLSLGGIISDLRTPAAAPETYATLAESLSPLLTVAFEWNR